MLLSILKIALSYFYNDLFGNWLKKEILIQFRSIDE